LDKRDVTFILFLELLVGTVGTTNIPYRCTISSR